MGLYTNERLSQDLRETQVSLNMDELQEAFFYDDHYADSDSEKRELLEEADVLMEAKKISRRTIVKLNKNDDLTRRTGMAALQLAKDNHDALWNKLVSQMMSTLLLSRINFSIF